MEKEVWSRERQERYRNNRKILADTEIRLNNVMGYEEYEIQQTCAR